MSNPQYPPPTSGSSGGNGVLILVLGILGIICLPILAPIAWVMGNNALPTASPDQRGQVNAGRICGIVGTILLVIYIIVYAVMGASIFHAAQTGALHPTPTTPFLWL